MEPTTRKMVLDTFLEDLGLYFSVREIRTKIFEKYQTSMDVHTIVKVIDELKTLHFKIVERIERRGQFKIPVKTFSINQLNNLGCSE